MALSSTGKYVCNVRNAIVLWLLTECVIVGIQLDIFSPFVIKYHIKSTLVRPSNVFIDCHITKLTSRLLRQF